jgi:hypothetical protein
MGTVYKSTDLRTAYEKYQQADQMISLTRWEGPPITVEVIKNSDPHIFRLNYEKQTVTEVSQNNEKT